MSRSTLPALALLLLAAPARAGEFTQIFDRADGTVLAVLDPAGTLTRYPGKAWDKKATAQGKAYYQCRYIAVDKSGAVVNEQLVWYFPEAPGAAGEDASHRWVYWYNPKSGVVWGRCPTPKHPDYKEWSAAKGADLWQLVPHAERPKIKGKTNITELGKAFAQEVLGQSDPAAPKVLPGKAKDAVTCVDFENATFS